MEEKLRELIEKYYRLYDLYKDDYYEAQINVLDVIMDIEQAMGDY